MAQRGSPCGKSIETKLRIRMSKEYRLIAFCSVSYVTSWMAAITSGSLKMLPGVGSFRSVKYSLIKKLRLFGSSAANRSNVDRRTRLHTSTVDTSLTNVSIVSFYIPFTYPP